jgi:hypothetical protein
MRVQYIEEILEKLLCFEARELRHQLQCGCGTFIMVEGRWVDISIIVNILHVGGELNLVRDY